MSGVLVLSRAAGLHAEYKERLEKMGFQDVTVTDKENDALNTVVCNKNPRLVMIDSWFYQDATPCRIGELVKLFPKLNIAVFSVHDFPVSRAPNFIWEGAKSYISLWEGYEEFHRGLQIVREGGQYISPKVQKLIDHCQEWPDTNSKITKRQKECLVMLCCGCTTDKIGEALHISRRTVYNHLNSLYSAFHAGSREEMVALAWEMELVTTKDIMFYNRKKERSQLPEWAVVKLKCDRFYSE
ncbi:MAG: LuxR C-terminal-related transcriptional regulator [Treponema sp.]|nr:LuxR C-terminal-related transcriptional regulator [Treponema sp.]